MSSETSPPAESKTAQPRNPVLRFFTHPAVSITTAISSLVSIPLAIFLFLQARENRELVYISHPVRTVIAQRERPGGLKIEFAGEVLSAVDVVAVRFAFWNHGNLSIRPANILSPIEIKFTPPVRVLEASVERQSREIIGLNLAGDRKLLQQGRIPISWRILEQGDGAILQIIYTGPRDAVARAEGIIEGQGNPRAITPPPKKKSDESTENEFGRLLPSTGSLIGGLIAVLFFTFLFVGMGFSILTDVRKKEWRRWYHYYGAYSVACLLMAAAVVSLVLGMRKVYIDWLGPTPPPGF